MIQSFVNSHLPPLPILFNFALHITHCFAANLNIKAIKTPNSYRENVDKTEIKLHSNSRLLIPHIIYICNKECKNLFDSEINVFYRRLENT